MPRMLTRFCRGHPRSVIAERIETAHKRLEPIPEACRRWRFLLRQPQPDLADAIVLDPMHHQHDGVERQCIPGLRRALKLTAKMIRQRGRGAFRCNRKSVDFRQRPSVTSPETKKSPSRCGSGAIGGGMSTEKR